MSPVEVTPVTGSELQDSLRLLEGWLRSGEPVPEGFAEDLRVAVEQGRTEVLAARADDRTVGVLVLAYRPNVSLGGPFASIEDLHVLPEARRLGVGSALLEPRANVCTARGVSYLEAQVEGDEAIAFYAALGYEPEPGVQVLSRSLAVETDKNS